MPGVRIQLFAGPLLAVISGFALPAPAAAQAFRFGGAEQGTGENGAESFASVQLPTDRSATRGMQRAEASIAAGEFSQAIRFLDDILGQGEDSFVELSGQGDYAGLKKSAQNLIRDLPPAGRQAYEASYGATAQRLLQAAIERGDGLELAKVAQRYFYTPAGYEAALMLAMDEADAGRQLSAALAYQQLLEAPEAVRRFDPTLSIRAAGSWLAAGEEEKARDVLNQLVARGEQSIEVAGRVHRLDAQREPLEWLREVVGEPLGAVTLQERQWLTYRGNAARNGSVSGGLPHLRVRWKVRLLDAPKLEQLFENLTADLIRTGRVLPVASNVVAAGDYLLTRTPQGLLAVDFKTGKRVWRSEPQREPVLEQLLQSAGIAEDQGGNPEPIRSFARRMWEDYLYGAVSSDGARVYMISNLSIPMSQEYELAPIMGGGDFMERGIANRLSAYELATQGKRLWEVDGESATGELAGSFFLGAPLSIGQSLYVLTESKGAIYLVALDREDGSLQWRQSLAHLETGVLLDLRRRLQSSMPSYDGGIIVCPTGAGVTLGVDLAKRSLAWAYRYDGTMPANGFNRHRHDDGSVGIARSWVDNAVAIADGRVVLTPPESEYIHCIDLQTGKLVWKVKRADMTRLSCIDNGRILLLGNLKARALNLADGKDIWKEPLKFPRGVYPAGTGFASEGKYFLPLTSAEVVAIDLADGKITARAATRDGVPLGSLICHRGAVLSQNGEYLDCYDQIDVLRRRSERRLEKEPRDIDALRTLGEVAFNEGRLSDAIQLLERAYREAPEDIETRDVLAECLAEALDGDFAAHRQKLSLLKELDDGGAGRRILIDRIEAQGMLLLGQPMASAQSCMKLYRLAGAPEEMLSIGRDHQTSIARWVDAQFAAIWEEADDVQQRELLAMVEQEIALLGPEPRGDALDRFLAFFGSLHASEPLKMRLARELALTGQSLEAQQLLLDLEKSADRDISREALGRISSQLHEAGLHPLAADYDDKLAGPLADEICFDDMTGAALTARWSASTANLPTTWPRGRVAVQQLPTTPSMGTRIRSPMWAIRMERTDSILGRASANLSSRGGEVVIYDNYGREFFHSSLGADNHLAYRAAGSSYAATRGNLLIVSLGRQVAAFNTLSPSDGLAPTMLWRMSAVSNLDYDQGFGMENGGGMATRPGSYRASRPTDAEGKSMGTIGPITSRGVVLQDQRRLVCLDPTSGEVRWSRTDVPSGCELFGDEKFVFAAPGSDAEARVYSARDGRYLGKRAVPPAQEQLVALGRNLLCWKVAGAHAELSSFDPWTGETAWTRQFDSGAAVDIEMGRYVAVVEGAGRVAVIDGVDGATQVDYQAPEKLRADEVHLTVGRDGFLVLVRGPRPMNRGRMVQGFNAIDSPVIDGSVMLFDRQSGEMRWSRPAEVEQQAYLLTQPADLPFILFAGQMVNRDNSGSRAMSTMLVLDKATGRTLLRTDELPQNGGGQCLARISDAAQHQATIELAGKTILLQFSDERRPPQPPAMDEVESEEKSGASGLMGIIRKISGS